MDSMEIYGLLENFIYSIEIHEQVKNRWISIESMDFYGFSWISIDFFQKSMRSMDFQFKVTQCYQ